MPPFRLHSAYRRKLQAALLSVSIILTPGSAHANSLETPLSTKGLSSDYRLEIIGYRLATRNAKRCDRPEMLTGMMLHDEAGFSRDARERAKTWYGFDNGFGVAQIVPGSAADEAGLQRGDEIIAINGEPTAPFARDLIGGKATYARTERFVAKLEAQLHSGPVALAVERDGAIHEISLTGAAGCGGTPVLIDSTQLNAWSDGEHVAVTRRMVGYTLSDDELAFVMAHEMAHNILGHNKRFSSGLLFLAEFGIGSGKVRKAELAADALAVEILDRAGYDMTAPEALLRRSGNNLLASLSLSHPGPGRRIAETNRSRGRIVLRRAAANAERPEMSATGHLQMANAGPAQPLPIPAPIGRASIEKLIPAPSPARRLTPGASRNAKIDEVPNLARLPKERNAPPRLPDPFGTVAETRLQSLE